MMRLVTALLSATLFCTPALAEECRYVSGHDWGTVTFTQKGARLEIIGETIETCSIDEGDDGGQLMVCPSDVLGPEIFNFAPRELSNPDHEALLILWDHVWYRQCFEPT